MSNFIGLAYAVVKNAGIDTSKMSPNEEIDQLIEASSNIYAKILYSKFKK